MSDDWQLLIVCDEVHCSDLEHLLADGLVRHRMRAVEERDRVREKPLGFAYTRFGSTGPRQTAIDVRAEDLDRGKYLVTMHFAELEAAAVRAAGEPATADRLAEDQRWVDARAERPRRAWLRYLAVVGLFTLGLVWWLHGLAVNVPRSEARHALGVYGTVVSEEGKDGYTLELEHGRGLVSGAIDDGAAAPLLVRPLYEERTPPLLVLSPSPELVAWLPGKTSATVTLHGHAVRVSQLDERVPGLGTRYRATLRCGPSFDQRPCSKEQLEYAWVFLVDR